MNAIQEAHVVQAAKQSPDAFRFLYETYHDKIYRYAQRLTHNPSEAEDVTAQTFAKA